MSIGYMVQYCVISLSIDKLPGNRYLNGIIFGFGEVTAMFFSQYLMGRMMDMSAFYVCYTLGVTSYLLLIFFPETILITYFANVMLMTGIGGWFNTMLLILELRVPPQNVGSVSALTRTLAVTAASMAPTISNLAAPIPYICLICLATFGFLLTFFLPAPG